MYIEIALMIVPPLLEYTHLLFIVAQSPHWLRLYCTAWIKPTCRVYFLRTQRVLSPNSSMDQNDDLHSMVPRGYIHQVAAGKHQKHRKLMGGWEYQKSFHCFFGKILHATSMFFFPFPWQNLWFCRFATRLKGHPLRELRSDTDDGIKCGAAGGSGKHHRTIGEPPGLAMVATRKVREGTPKWAHWFFFGVLKL